MPLPQAAEEQRFAPARSTPSPARNTVRPVAWAQVEEPYREVVLEPEDHADMET